MLADYAVDSCFLMLDIMLRGLCHAAIRHTTR